MMRSRLVSVPVLLLLLFGSARESGAGSGVIKGKVVFDGKAPKPKMIQMEADPKCQEMHGGQPAAFETMVVAADGSLANVFVYVKQGLEGQTFPAPTKPVVLDQKGCEYHPHVFGIQVGQPLEVYNSDPTLHNVHSLGKVGPFNLGMPPKPKPWSLTKRFDKPEPDVIAHIKCDVHAWMSAYVGILPHPFFGVTGKDGAYKIANLPAGSYVIEAWHEKFGRATQAVSVADGQTKEVVFTVKMGEGNQPVFSAKAL